MLSTAPDGESLWQNATILWDAATDDSEPLWSFAQAQIVNGSSTRPILLFNVSPESILEKEALDGGFLGVFYQDDDIGVLLKGLQAVMEGQLWFSRKTLQQHLVNIRNNVVHYSPRHVENNRLTAREKEILGLMTSGVNNQDIANRLCVSPHTVKTHITNIYRKIGVENRLQAILWAHRNI
jgi:LuxR family transcriptional regulator of csgAB operon